MICAIVLAAGRSERMGAQKLLLPLGGKPLIRRVVDELSASQVGKILVVVGSDGARMRQSLTGQAVQFVQNSSAGSTMLDSVRCGLRALPPDCEAVLVALGDQPGITRLLVDALIGSFLSESDIIVPTCQGHRGHPVLFSSRHFSEVLTCHSATGLRGFLNAHSKEVTNVAVSDPTAMEDMDTLADYQRQEKLFAKRYAETVSPP